MSGLLGSGNEDHLHNISKKEVLVTNAKNKSSLCIWKSLRGQALKILQA